MESVANLDPNIVATAVITEDDVKIRIKKNGKEKAIPQLEELREVDLRRLTLQATHAISIGMTNERLLGELNYVMFHHKSLTAILFPMNTFKILAIGLGGPSDIVRLTFRIADLIRKYTEKEGEEH